MVLGILVVVILGVGAFSFMGGGSSEQAAPAATPSKAERLAKLEEEARKKDAEEAMKASKDGHVAKNPQFANDLSERNPFKPDYTLYKVDPPKPDPTKTASQPSLPAPRIPSPAALGGSLPGPAPVSPNSGVAVVKAPEPVFGYKCMGVVDGEHPAAIFADASGAQKMVLVGSAIDGDSRVVNIGRNTVTVIFHGKKQTLLVGGN